MRISDPLETILSLLSARVTSTIADGTCIHHLNLLLEFLAAWEKRPERLTRMVCQWCSTISETVGRLRPSETQIEPPKDLRILAECGLRLRPQEVEKYSDTTPALFAAVWSDCDSGGSDATHTRVQHSLPQYLYKYLLFVMLEVGFRLARTDATWGSIRPDDTSYHERIFETAFSSYDDDVIADAVGMWIMSSGRTPLGLFTRHLTERLGRVRPLSQELRQLIIRAVECTWEDGSWESGPETIHLLNCLDADMDNLIMHDRVGLLSSVVVGPGGLELSPHYWHLLDRSVEEGGIYFGFKSGDLDPMRALREAEDWEKLEVWMLVMWKALVRWCSTLESMEDIQQVTLELLSRRPSALRRFENIWREKSDDLREKSHYHPKRVLRDICERARAEIENLPSEESPGLPYVLFDLQVPICSNFTLFFSQPAPTQQLIPLIFAGDDTF